MNTLEAVVACILSVIAAATPAVLALFKIQQLHVIVNSRLTELLMVSKAAAMAEGKAEGSLTGDDIVNRLENLSRRLDTVADQREELLTLVKGFASLTSARTLP
jgi:predicted transcriptional regulator